MKHLRTFSTRNRGLIFCGAIIACLLSFVLSVCLGAARLSPSTLWLALTSGANASPEARIIWYVRLPRTAACLLSGAGLAVSGAVIQAVLANSLAAPNIIGVNAGASLAVTIACASGAVTGWAITGAAFGGALFAVLLVVFIAQKTGASRMTVTLGGVAISSFLTAITEAIITLFPDASIATADFRVGGFSAVSLVRLIPAGILIAIAILVTLSLCNELDILSLGEETAQGLGLPVRKIRFILLGLAALLAGASVSFAGSLGFVGLIVPHMARQLVGDESRFLLPMCVLFGATLVTLCDLAARLLFQPYELPVGILLSFIGGPFFLVLLKKRGAMHHD